MELQDVLIILKNLLSYMYVKVIAFYVIYIAIVFFIIFPIGRKLFQKLVSKTKTKWDDELHLKISPYIKILALLFGLNLVYNFLLLEPNRYWQIWYKILLSIEFGILYLISHTFFKISLKYFIKKFSGIITKNVANFVKLVIDILVFSVIILLVLKVWWVNITPLLASAGIFGLAVAMASKSIIENFLSWLILFADKSINVWDTIVLSDWTIATVEEINIRTTRLKTFDGNVVIIPNSELLNEKIINKSLADVTPKKRVEVTVWISYWDDVDKAKELLKNYLLELDGADKESIVVFVDELADWSVNITWRIMVDADKFSFLMSKQVLEKVYKNFPNEGLNFPFPTYELTWNLNCNKN